MSVHGLKPLEFDLNDKVETKDVADNEAISFSLLICDLNQQIMCKVNPDDSLWNLKIRLVSSTSAKKFADGLNYGFFCPANSGRIGKYLGETRSIKEFSEKDLRDLQFRYKKKNYRNLPANLKKLRAINDLSHRKSFIQAINSNKINDIMKMLKKGHDPNYQDIKTGETPMTVAILSGAPTEVLVHLVEEGAHLDYRNSHEMTPVHVASINGKVEYLKTLLELGASANYRNSDNLTPLHYLSSGSDLDTLMSCSQLLLENYSVVDVADDAGNTELHHAARQGRLLLAKKLIIYGANINRRNFVGNTPLHMAIFNNQEVMAKKLLTYGADKWISNRANYDILTAAMTIENKQLAEYIQQFDESQIVRIKDEPIYHPKRKADSSRRPSMLEFLNQQQKQLQVKNNTLSKQISCPNDNKINNNKLYNNGSSNNSSTTGLITPNTADPDKIGDYISQIFGSIQDGEPLEMNQNNQTNSLQPLFENQKASSFADVRRERTESCATDDFTDSEDEATDAVAPVVIRPSKSVTSPQNRPATLFITPSKPTPSSSPLLAYALQNQMRQHASTISLSARNSPLPVAKLQPKTNSQQDLKIASIKSYPKRLTTKETDILVSRNEKISSSVAERQRNQYTGPTVYPATLNQSSVKARPSLKEIFPCDSMTNIAKEANFDSSPIWPKELPAIAESSVNNNLNNPGQYKSAHIILPGMKHSENIYDEIPSIKVETYRNNEGFNSGMQSAIYSLPILTGYRKEMYEKNVSPKYHHEDSHDEEIYANIGPDGQVLSYYDEAVGHKIWGDVRHKEQQIQISPNPTFEERDLEDRSELAAAKMAENMSNVLTKSVMEDFNKSLATVGTENDQIDSKHQWLQQQLHLKTNSNQFNQPVNISRQEINPNDYRHELEMVLLNQRTKLNKPQTPDKNPHVELLRDPYDFKQSQFSQQLKHVSDTQQQQQMHIPQLQQVQQTRKQDFNQNTSRETIPSESQTLPRMKFEYHPGMVKEPLPIETQTLPRQRQRSTNERPMSSFFETSQHSLRSLDSPDNARFDSLPLGGYNINNESDMMERSNSVGILHESSADKVFNSPPQTSTPFFIMRPTAIHQNPTNLNERTSLSNQLNIPPASIYKANSYQDVYRNKVNSQGTARSNRPHLPPKPPKRTTSIPNSRDSLSVFPPPPDFRPIPPPHEIPGEVQKVVLRRGNKTFYTDIPTQGSHSLASSPNRNSYFESFGLTQNEIKKKLNQLRTRADVHSYSIQPVEHNAPLTFVQGKSTSKDFNENRAKLEKLFSGVHLDEDSPNTSPISPRSSAALQETLQDPRVSVDDTTGQMYFQVDHDGMVQEWSV